MQDEPRAKDTDPRPLLARVRDALAAVLGASFEDGLAGDGAVQLTARIGEVAATFREAAHIKGLAVSFGTAPAAPPQRALQKVTGARVSGYGRDADRQYEVSWRGLEAFCAALAAPVKPTVAKKVAAPKPPSDAALRRLMAALAEGGGLVCSLGESIYTPNELRVRTATSLRAWPLRLLADGRKVRVEFAYEPEAVAAVKAVPGAKYDPETKGWLVAEADTPALADALRVAAVALMAASERQEAEARRRVAAKELDDIRHEANRAVARNAAARAAEPQVPQPARKPRLPVLLSRGLAVGDTLRCAGTLSVIESFGKVFRVSDDASSVWSGEFAGCEGDQVRYAYLRHATPAEVAALEAREAAARAAKVAGEVRRAVVAAIQAAGEFVTPQAIPEGEHLVRAPVTQTPCGFGEDVILAGDGALWLVQRHGGDGDRWDANNLPGARGWRLADGERARELTATLRQTANKETA